MYQEWLKKYEEITKNKPSRTDMEKLNDVLLHHRETKEVRQAIENALQYIEQLENRVKELGKGQHALMQSRRKWKKRYYKERRKRRELEKPFTNITHKELNKMLEETKSKRNTKKSRGL